MEDVTMTETKTDTVVPYGPDVVVQVVVIVEVPPVLVTVVRVDVPGEIVVVVRAVVVSETLLLCVPVAVVDIVLYISNISSYAVFALQFVP
jgi:hypothetical protein